MFSYSHDDLRLRCFFVQLEREKQKQPWKKQNVEKQETDTDINYPKPFR